MKRKVSFCDFHWNSLNSQSKPCERIFRNEIKSKDRHWPKPTTVLFHYFSGSLRFFPNEKSELLRFLQGDVADDRDFVPFVLIRLDHQQDPQDQRGK